MTYCPRMVKMFCEGIASVMTMDYIHFQLDFPSVGETSEPSSGDTPNRACDEKSSK